MIYFRKTRETKRKERDAQIKQTQNEIAVNFRYSDKNLIFAHTPQDYAGR